MRQVDDGFGNIWVCAHELDPPLCKLHVVRPGKARCPCMGGVEGLMSELQFGDEIISRLEKERNRFARAFVDACDQEENSA